jgi:hypothetical protein
MARQIFFTGGEIVDVLKSACSRKIISVNQHEKLLRLFVKHKNKMMK